MAITLSEKNAFNIGIVIQGAIETARIAKSREQARKESEFQKAIADGGVSFEAQLDFRKKQLEEEKKSSIPDANFIQILEKSIGDIKKLARFNRIRTRYVNTFAELSSGRINEQQYLDTLKFQIKNVNDPELRLEVQAEIAKAEQKLKNYNDTILNNQVRKARSDGTQKTLKDAISRVRDARMQALINDNQDEVTLHDETLASLNAQLEKVVIEDTINDFRVRSSTRGVSPMEKLNFINGEIGRANSDITIRIGDTTYESAQQFWTLERNNFLAGSSEEFGDFFTELGSFIRNTINANAIRFGYPTQGILDEAFNAFNILRTRPEFAPFINELNITQATIMSEAVEKFARKIIDSAILSLDFNEALQQLKNVGQKYGVNTESYISALLQSIRGLEQGKLIPEGTSKELEGKEIEVTLPEIKTEPSKPSKELPPTELKQSPTELKQPTKTLRDFGYDSDAIIGSKEASDFITGFFQQQTGVLPPQEPTVTPEVKKKEEPTTQPVKPVETPQLQQKVYVVRPGDTLDAIAQNQLGDAARAFELTTEEGKKFDKESAKKLQIGTKLIIPQ